MTEQEELAMLLNLQHENWLQWQKNESEMQVRNSRMYTHLCERYGRYAVETSFIASGKRYWAVY